MQAYQDGPGIIHSLLAGAEAPSRLTPAWTRARASLNNLAAADIAVAEVISAGASTRHTAVAARSLALTLATLAHEIRARAPDGGLLIMLDELQVSGATQLALLAAVLQQLNTEHPDSPVAFAASALPDINNVLREAGVTHHGHLFDTQSIPVELDRAAARYAIVEPARHCGVVWSELATNEVLAATRGYPAHLQLFAHRTWKLADGPHEITADDARRGIEEAERHVETQTLDPRWRRATERQVELLAALAVAVTAEPDNGYATTARISSTVGRAANAWSGTRAQLINESDIYAPACGRFTFTVPTYAAYILRNYEAARADARLELTPLSVMSQRSRARDRSSAEQIKH